LRSFVDETAEKGKLYTYVITSLDRLKNESEASNSVTVKAY
jgi:fibronectin type 3 domain-containing protein